MLNADRTIIFIFLICVSIYTSSYGYWTWKRKNKLGAIMVFLLAATTVLLPAYVIFSRG